MDVHSSIVSTFGNRLRVRVCGILIEGEKVLLIKHLNLGPAGVLWSPPGGGMEFGESAEETLKREFVEETGLEVEIVKFLFVNEFLNPPLHGIELFFWVKNKGGKLNTGMDPELTNNYQIIQEAKFLSIQQLKQMPAGILHSALTTISTIEEITQLTGYALNGKFIK